MNAVDLRLCGIIDPERSRGRDLSALAKAAAAGGCTLMQYRDKQSGVRAVVERARALKAALADSGVPLLIDDRVDVALAVEADGVHLGQEGMHPADARRLLGPQAIIGLSLETGEQADALYRLSVDYARIGTIFATQSQDSPQPPIGLDGLSRVAFRARLASGVPVGAAAGIDHTNAGSVVAAGADGIAVISAIFMADDPRAAAQRLRAIVDLTLAARGRLP